MRLSIGIDSTKATRKLAKIGSKETRRQINEVVGMATLEHVRDHLSTASVSRHKVADRLGATHTGFLEHAAGRTVLSGVDDKAAHITIRNTPGLSRAFHDMEITPVRAKWLTIPLSRISYGKRVRDLERSGHDVFRPGNARILAETTGQTETYVGSDGKKRKRKRLRPLYALCKKVRVPRDEGLLPTVADLRRVATMATEDVIESLAELAAD